MVGTNSKINTKTNTKGLDKLLDMGGFISDVAAEAIIDGYSAWAIEPILADADFYPQNLVYAEKLELIMNERHSYIFSLTSCLDGDILDVMKEWENDEYNPTEYMSWFMKQVYDWEKKKDETQMVDYWTDILLDRRAKRIISRLSAFEERLLYLRCGIDKGNVRTIEEVSNITDFCDPKFVIKCLQIIQKVLENENLDMQKLVEQCEQGIVR